MAEAGLIWTLLSGVLVMTTVGLGWAYRRARHDADRSVREGAMHAEVVEGSNDAVLVIDFVDGRILRANARAANLLGRSNEEMLGLTVFELHAPEHLSESATRIADAWERKGMVYDDIPFIAADGTTIAVECSTAVTYHGERPAVVLFARDIRDRLRLQHEVAEQQAIVAYQNTELFASLRYASAIQSALLPTEAAMRQHLRDAFVLHRPRDIVSGDLHWIAEIGGNLVVAVADCTGHGVPGAFLGLIGNALLRQVVVEDATTDPAIILERLSEGMTTALFNNGQPLSDGMDIAVVCIHTVSLMMTFAGAMNPAYVVRSTGDGPVLNELKADRRPIGRSDVPAAFTRHTFQLRPGDAIYLFSDGFADQFGGPLGKKMKPAGLRQLLLENARLDMARQREALDNAFVAWRGQSGQTDDVLVVGLRV